MELDLTKATSEQLDVLTGLFSQVVAEATGTYNWWTAAIVNIFERPVPQAQGSLS